ncbi:hypothetical protein GOBAR_DD08186 [Gossypium barbadense]|nr:hypothetical protein GOBAR_DD08186 [Gossypium barbadense]
MIVEMRVSVPAPLASLLRFWQRMTLAAKGMLIRVVPLGTVRDQKGIMVLVHVVDRGSKRMRQLFEEDDDGGDMVINEQQGDQASFKDILTLSNKSLSRKGIEDGDIIFKEDDVVIQVENSVPSISF